MYTWYRKEGVTPVDHTTFGNLLQVHEEPAIFRSHIDHVWVSSDLVKKNCVSHYNICKQAIASTDHRPVLLSLNIKEALGLTVQHTSTVLLRRRKLLFKNKLQCKRYKKVLMTKVSDSNIASQLEQCQEAGTTVTESQMDTVMEILVTLLIESEDASDTKPDRAGTRKFLSHHSEELVCSVRARRECITQLAQSKYMDKTDDISTCRSIAVKYKQTIKLPECPHHFAMDSEWIKWSAHVELAIKELRTKLHAKTLLQTHIKSSAWRDKIKKTRQTSSDSKNIYAYVTDSVYIPPATQLFVEGIWVDTPSGIKRIEETNLHQHMYGRTCTYHSEGDCKKTLSEPDAWGKKLRQKIADGSSDE